VEKALKALVIEKDLEFRKTHNIQQLRDMLTDAGFFDSLTDEECELLDSIYLPSKYPLGPALPSGEPDMDTCKECSLIAEKTLLRVRSLLGG